jgi:hypothetical protein
VQVDNEVFYPHCTAVSATEADASYHIPYHEQLVLADFGDWKQRTLASGDVPDELAGALEQLDTSRTPAFAAVDLATRLLAFRFLGDMVAGYHGWVVDELRHGGITVPVVANAKHAIAYLDWDTIGAPLDLLGYNNYFDDPRRREELLNLVWWNRLQRAKTDLPWATELWSGKWVEVDQDTSVFRPEHYRFVTLLDIANGLRSANFFMFVERDDWHYSPVTAIGKPRPNLLSPYDSILGTFRALGPDRLRAEVGLLWTIEQHQAHVASTFADWTTLSSIWWQSDQPKEDGAWWSTLHSLVATDTDFVVVDGHAEASAGRPWPPVVVYGGGEAIARPVFARLLEHSRRATVVVTGVWPQRDLGGARLDLAEELRAHAVYCEPGRLAETLSDRGVVRYAQADRDGCLTSVFVGADRTALFACNVTGWPLPVKVRLDRGLAGELRRAPVRYTSRSDGRVPWSPDGSEISFSLTAHRCDVVVWSSMPGG